MICVHVDCFTTALEDLRGAAARDPIVVFDTILQQGGRFSTFDINTVLAKPVDFLFGNGYLKDDGTLRYPYTRCVATDLGHAWREGRLCQSCKGKGSTSRQISKRSAMVVPCEACGRTGIARASSHE